MATLDQLLLLISGLGGIHGSLLACYLYFRRPGTWSNRFLAGLILAVSIRVLKSVLFYFNPGIGKQILQLGLSACFLIGPLLYCYTLEFLGVYIQSRFARLHILFPIALIVIIGTAFPYHQYPELWGGLLYKVINYIWLAYTLFSVATLLPTLYQIKPGNWRQHLDLIFASSIVLGSGLIWSAYYFASYTSYIAGALSFSFLICIGLFVLFRNLNRKEAVPSPYANKKIPEEQAETLIVELDKFMSEQKVYLDANLTLAKLAKMMAWSAPKLSQLLNDNLQKSFNEYVNSYRINYAKTLMTGETSMKMEDLAENSGFNSLSTFYSAFKKHTQLTPAKYKALQATGNSEIMNS